MMLRMKMNEGRTQSWILLMNIQKHYCLCIINTFMKKIISTQNLFLGLVILSDYTIESMPIERFCERWITKEIFLPDESDE